MYKNQKEKYMKKFLKTLAVCFMALISCFTFFACNETKNPDTPNNSEQGTTPGGGSNGGQTTTQINEANYTKMKNLANATDPTNGYKVEIINKDAMNSTWDILAICVENLTILIISAKLKVFHNSAHYSIRNFCLVVGSIEKFFFCWIGQKSALYKYSRTGAFF